VGLCTPSVHLRHRYIRCFQTHADLLPRMATTARQNGKPNNAPQYKFFDNLMYHQQEQYSPRHLRKPFVDIILGIISSCVLHPPFAYAYSVGTPSISNTQFNLQHPDEWLLSNCTEREAPSDQRRLEFADTMLTLITISTPRATRRLT